MKDQKHTTASSSPWPQGRRAEGRAKEGRGEESKAGSCQDGVRKPGPCSHPLCHTGRGVLPSLVTLEGWRNGSFLIPSKNTGLRKVSVTPDDGLLMCVMTWSPSHKWAQSYQGPGPDVSTLCGAPFKKGPNREP